MESLDWVGKDVWYAHAIHVNDDEIRTFAAKGAGICHCPSSNMRLASGIAPVKKYRDAGVRTGLGVDGASSNDGSNLLIEVREAMLLARLKIGLLPPEGPRTVLSTSDPLRASEWMTARDALEIATIGGASVLGRSDIGSLEPGKCADFFTLGPQCAGLCRRARRSGGRRRLLRPDPGASHGGRRPSDRRGWRDRHARHESCHPGPQPQRRAAGGAADLGRVLMNRACRTKPAQGPISSDSDDIADILAGPSRAITGREPKG